MHAYGKLPHIFVLALCLALSAGCAGLFGNAGNGEPYYYAEFDDIPIPSQLGGIKETTIITTPGGVKTGLQVFKGRVEVGSLNSAMVGYMQREGWEMRSSTRGTRSLLLFEKDDRYATIYILDGTFNTEMQVYVSPKLSNMAGVRTAPRQVEKPSAPANKPAPEDSSGGAANVPTSSFDSQSLSE